MPQRCCMCFNICVSLSRTVSQGVTTFTYALGQLNAFLSPGASCGHFLSCFGAQKTMLFPQEAGHPLSFPPTLSSPHHLSDPWDHGHYDCNNYSGSRSFQLQACCNFFVYWFRDGTHFIHVTNVTEKSWAECEGVQLAFVRVFVDTNLHHKPSTSEDVFSL